MVGGGLGQRGDGAAMAGVDGQHSREGVAQWDVGEAQPRLGDRNHVLLQGLAEVQDQRALVLEIGVERRPRETCPTDDLLDADLGVRGPVLEQGNRRVEQCLRVDLAGVGSSSPLGKRRHVLHHTGYIAA